MRSLAVYPGGWLATVGSHPQKTAVVPVDAAPAPGGINVGTTNRANAATTQRNLMIAAA